MAKDCPLVASVAATFGNVPVVPLPPAGLGDLLEVALHGTAVEEAIPRRIVAGFRDCQGVLVLFVPHQVAPDGNFRADPGACPATRLPGEPKAALVALHARPEAGLGAVLTPADGTL